MVIIEQRNVQIVFKAFLLTFKAVNGLAPNKRG